MKHPTYTLYQISKALVEKKPGHIFEIKGQEFLWEFYDDTRDFFWIRNTTTKQTILIQKP